MPEQIRDRAEAGRLLAERLASYAGCSDVTVLALPRGGVPVAFEIAKALRAPLDIFLVRKLGVPGFEELALGSITINGTQMINPDVVEEFGLTDAQVSRVVAVEKNELERRDNLYRGSKRPLDVKGRTVIVVDDGVATGATVRAAIRALRQMGCARIVAAVGVAPLRTGLFLGSEADEVVCLKMPTEFHAVGQFYEKFPQLTDEDVLGFLDTNGGPSAQSAA
jgi:predicted phosphoribosyltransferase